MLIMSLLKKFMVSQPLRPIRSEQTKQQRLSLPPFLKCGTVRQHLFNIFSVGLVVSVIFMILTTFASSLILWLFFIVLKCLHFSRKFWIFLPDSFLKQQPTSISTSTKLVHHELMNWTLNTYINEPPIKHLAKMINITFLVTLYLWSINMFLLADMTLIDLFTFNFSMKNFNSKY